MASEKQLRILKQGIKDWNEWLQQERKRDAWFRPDLRGAYLREADLSRADLSRAYFSGACLDHARLVGTNLSRAYLREADLHEADLSEADLRGAHLRRANLSEADLSWAHLSGADLREADLYYARLSGANLIGTDLSWANLSMADLSGAMLVYADLSAAVLVETNLEGAILTNCRIYGISAWNLNLKGAEQTSLNISRSREPTITVDNLEVAQFIYLLLNNERIRDIIDTIARKVVLILGRFTPERKAVLDAIREQLRQHDYLPVVFDFDKPATRDLTETIRTLAHLSRFIIADITEPRSIPQELQAIVPDLAVPVQPLLLEGSTGEYGMFQDLRDKYHWVLAVHHYRAVDDLLQSLEGKVLKPAEEKAKELDKRGRATES